MRFVPPRCPNELCEQHVKPVGQFYELRGFYQPRCRTEPVPRFRCRHCRRGFSRQTFRHDYGDRKPDTNVVVWKSLISGTGIRQTARMAKLDMHSVQGKLRKMGRTCGFLHDNLSPKLPAGRTFLFDEEETFERASHRPLTMPVLIERETWFVVSTSVGSIRRLAVLGSARRLAQDLEEAVAGPRPDQSLECIRKVLKDLHRRTGDGNVVLQTDQKASYATAIVAEFGDKARHETTPGRLARGTHNPLFPINTTLAMTRDNNGRLRRQSWLVTKLADRLERQMALFTVYRNYVRRRFNRDKENETAAVFLGLLPRHLHEDEVLAWRQDWGALSPHPMSASGSKTVGEKIEVAA